MTLICRRVLTCMWLMSEQIMKRIQASDEWPICNTQAGSRGRETMYIYRFLSEQQNNKTENSSKIDSGNASKVDPSNKISSLETELKEMRERYLHMSLQYAEVEAQREELVMQLKSAAKKDKKWFS
ncbi:hypothetical protein M5K25_001346 [Dendrobium thyrsiflorum]|uniref:Uncharacterized protein n=1 Tax=Dendrobium thyrsiflorum TaxID=117978 RepID=A0ABD0VRF9_DENTH